MSSEDGFWILVSFAVVGGLIWGILADLKNRKKQPKANHSKPKLSSNSQPVNSEDSEHDVTYGEDTFEQEDDEFHEEVW